jgi:peptide/nickel transport system permease protein
MPYFIAKRILQTIPALLGVSVIIFFMLNVLPGDPLASLLGEDATPEARELLAQSLGLDAPLPVQYWRWLTSAIQGDLGNSFARNRPVVGILIPAFRATLFLASWSALIGVVTGVFLGTIGALNQGKVVDRIVGVISMIGLSIPSYWLGMLLIIVFASQLRLLPASGMARSGSSLFETLRYVILPSLANSAVTIGLIARTTRASLIASYAESYIVTLNAKGMRGYQVLLHAWKNIAPSVLAVAGLQVGFLLGGSVLVEPIFSWPGMGSVIYDSIVSRDLRVIQAAVLFVAVTFVVINLFVDILQIFLNPRLRKG